MVVWVLNTISDTDHEGSHTIDLNLKGDSECTFTIWWCSCITLKAWAALQARYLSTSSLSLMSYHPGIPASPEHSLCLIQQCDCCRCNQIFYTLQTPQHQTSRVLSSLIHSQCWWEWWVLIVGDNLHNLVLINLIRGVWGLHISMKYFSLLILDVIHDLSWYE